MISLSHFLPYRLPPGGSGSLKPPKSQPHCMYQQWTAWKVWKRKKTRDVYLQYSCWGITTMPMHIVAVWPAMAHGCWPSSLQPFSCCSTCQNNQAVVTQIRHTLLGMEINNWFNNNYLHTLLALWYVESISFQWKYYFADFQLTLEFLWNFQFICWTLLAVYI